MNIGSKVDKNFEKFVTLFGIRVVKFLKLAIRVEVIISPTQQM